MEQLKAELKLEAAYAKIARLERELRKQTCAACGMRTYVDHIHACIDCRDVFFCYDCSAIRCDSCDATYREKLGSCEKCLRGFYEGEKKVKCMRCQKELCEDCSGEHGIMCEDCFMEEHDTHSSPIKCNVCEEKYCPGCSVLYGIDGCPEGCSSSAVSYPTVSSPTVSTYEYYGCSGC